LYTYDGNFRALKVAIAANYSGVKVDVDPKFVFGETNKSEAFLKKFNSSKVPAFETKDGRVHLTQGDAIAHFVSNDNLKGGACGYAQAQVIQHLSFVQTELIPAALGWVLPSLSIMQFQKDNVAKAKAEVELLLHQLDNHLLAHTYLVGESITLADISVFAALFDIFKHLLDAESRKLFVNVSRWFDTILNQTKVKEAMNKLKFDFSYCVTPAKFDAAKHKENTASGQTQPAKKPEKKKEEKGEKPKPKPKEKEAEEPAEEMDAAEAALAAEPKSKDPLDALPKGTWVMDDFKRFYSNNDVEQSIPYFWDKFDPENYSIWFGEYKYNNELTKVFMSCNLITGMYQRLDKMRKNAFASVNLYGDDNNSTISGVWVWRGQELAFPQSPDWQIDYETYDWKKLDPKDAETKRLVKEYFSWEGTDKEGRKFNQGKVFK